MVFDLSRCHLFFSMCLLLVLKFVSQGSGDRPIVVLFGWAGAKHKHLDKYAELYRWGRSWNHSTNHLLEWENCQTIIVWTTRDHGCDTVQYILPTRFIFRHTDQVQIINSLSENWKKKPPNYFKVPEALQDVASHLSDNRRPLAIHCLSDTGVMTAQVGQIVQKWCFVDLLSKTNGAQGLKRK